jgi:hypothetical protein
MAMHDWRSNDPKVQTLLQHDGEELLYSIDDDDSGGPLTLVYAPGTSAQSLTWSSQWREHQAVSPPTKEEV